MKAQYLYQKLEVDFKLSEYHDDWSQMDFNKYISENFRKRYMGLVLDNTDEIERVYTAVFPSDKVLTEILEKGERNVLLFTHHPSTWDTKVVGFPFRDMNKDLLVRLKENKISLYTLHVPLDANGEYSTTVNYAKAVGVSYEEDFAAYYGAQVGVIGKSNFATLDDLAVNVEEAVGHKIGVLKYGSSDIEHQKIAMVAGGGNDLDVMGELLEWGIKTFITGVSRAVGGYPPAVEFDKLARENKINVIGASHYSSEKFACIKMLDYFKKLGFETLSFIDDKPDMGDF